MLERRQSERGMSMIELMVGITIVAILLALAAPSFSTWIQNTHIRTAAEAIQSGLTLARGEAVGRNALVRFQLTSTLDNSCAVLTSGTNWVVSQDDPSGACATAIADPSDLNPPAPRIIQTRAGAEGSRNAAVAADVAFVTFNGLGRLTPAAGISINISNPIGGACAPAGPMRCLRVVVSTAGQVRMCDPAFVFSATNPQGC